MDEQELQRPSRLIELQQHHARLCWRLGEHAWLKPEDLSQLQADSANGAHEEMVPKKKKKDRKTPLVEGCVQITSCHTRVDVIWQVEHE